MFLLRENIKVGIKNVVIGINNLLCLMLVWK